MLVFTIHAVLNGLTALKTNRHKIVLVRFDSPNQTEYIIGQVVLFLFKEFRLKPDRI